MKIQYLHLLIILSMISGSLLRVKKKSKSNKINKIVNSRKVRLMKQTTTATQEMETSETTQKGGSNESLDRNLCDIKVEETQGTVTIDKKMVDMKYLKGKLVMVGQVEDQGEKECELLDLNKCQSSSRNHLGKSIFFKSLNIGANKLRFSFNFFVGVSKELGLCSIRVAMKNGEDTFVAQEKVMSYFPQDLFAVDKQQNQKSFTKEIAVFNGKSTQEALEMCAKPLESDQKMFVSNFYQTFEGFLLSEGQNKQIAFKCEKSKKMKDVAFTAQSGDMKKVDVFVDNQQYTKISIKGDDKSKVGIEEKKIDESQKGDNLGTDMKVYSFKVYGQSYYNYNNNHCYDLDMKHVARAFTKSTFSSNFDNNVQFNFEAVAMAVETTQGAMCAVYAVAQGLDSKYYVQNDMLLKFQKKGMTYSNLQCGNTLQKFNCQNGKPSDLFNSRDSRFLAGAVLNAIVDSRASVYCQIDISDNVSLEQYRQDQYNRIFYETATTQFVDNQNEEELSSTINSQIAAAKQKIKQFQQKEAEVPNYSKLPFDMWTRKDISDMVQGGDSLGNYQFIRSKSGLYSAVMQEDNNLVVYRRTNDQGGYEELWSSGSGNEDSGKGIVKMTTEGQLQIVNSATQAILYSTTKPTASTGFFLVIQNDGNLVIYDNQNSPKWSSKTNQNANYFTLKSQLIPNSLYNGFQQYFGLILRSTNGKYILQLEQKGNLVVKISSQNKQEGQIIWQSRGTITDLNKFTINLKMEDGNLVEYQDKQGKEVLWQSNSQGKGGSQLQLTDSGLLQIVDTKNNVIWKSTQVVDDIWNGQAEDTLQQGQSLQGGQFLRSRNNQYVLLMQKDKDLVVYRKSTLDGGKEAIWSSKSKDTEQSICKVTLDDKGVISVTDNISNKPLYTSTFSSTGSNFKLVMQNDGNLVVYNSDMKSQFTSNTPDNSLFSTKQLLPNELPATFTQYWGYLMISANKQYLLQLNQQCQLQLLKKGAQGESHSIVFQKEQSSCDYQNTNIKLNQYGQLIFFKKESTSSWSSPQYSAQTATLKYKLQLTDEGQLQIVNSNNQVMWDPSILYEDIWASTIDTLTQNSNLFSGQSLVSKDGLYAAVLLPTNQLAVYLRTKKAKATKTQDNKKQIFITEATSGCIGSGVLRLSDNNLSIYDQANKKQLLLIKTSDYKDNNHLIQQVDGNLVFYDKNYSPQWNAGTVLDQYTLDTDLIPSQMDKNKRFYIGQTIIRSPNKKSYIKYKWNAQITIFTQGQSEKQINKDSLDYKTNKEQFFIFQNDGNLVFYQKSSNPTWASGTVGSSMMELEDGGTLRIFNDNKQQTYSSSSRRFKQLQYNKHLITRFKKRNSNVHKKSN